MSLMDLLTEADLTHFLENTVILKKLSQPNRTTSGDVGDNKTQRDI